MNYVLYCLGSFHYAHEAVALLKIQPCCEWHLYLCTSVSGGQKPHCLVRACTESGASRPLFPQWSHHVYPQFLPGSHPNAVPNAAQQPAQHQRHPRNPFYKNHYGANNNGHHHRHQHQQHYQQPQHHHHHHHHHNNVHATQRQYHHRQGTTNPRRYQDLWHVRCRLWWSLWGHSTNLLKRMHGGIIYDNGFDDVISKSSTSYS